VLSRTRQSLSGKAKESGKPCSASTTSIKKTS
jgi:hypothetical protein